MSTADEIRAAVKELARARRDYKVAQNRAYDAYKRVGDAETALFKLVGEEAES